jgi:hypothetical protein
MDIISLSKAMKAKKSIKNVQDRLGMNGTEAGGVDVKGGLANVKTRLEAIEAKDPHVTLFNRVGEVEANTTANLNKHNLRMNAVVNKNRYNMSDLAFDDFGDSTGIDAAKSTGHLFDAAGKKVKINTGQTQAEVVTTAEVLTVDPQMVVVAQSGLVKDTDSRKADLANGTFVNAEVVDGKIQLHVMGTQLAGYTPNVIPAMTGVNTPSGQVIYSASYEPNASYRSWYPFDGSDGAHGVWSPPQYTLIGYLGYVFPVAKTITKYRIKGGGSSGDPKSWTFEGSNDGSHWDILDTKSNQVFVSGAYNDYPIINTKSYTQYRVNISSNNGSSYWLQIYSIQMMETGVQNLYSPNGSYESPVLDLGDNYKDFVNVISTINNLAPDYTDDVAPTMTSNTTPAPYVVTSSSAYNGYHAWNVFDKLDDNGHAYNILTFGSATNQWVVLDFGMGNEKAIAKYDVYTYTSNRAPKNWTFEGSNTGAFAGEQVILDTQTNQTSWSTFGKNTYTINNTTKYRYYRIFISSGNDGSWLELAELKMYERKPAGAVTISTATSTDGVTFTSYAPLNTDNTVASPTGRYIKFKVDMTGGGQVQNRLLMDYVAGDAGTYQTDAQVLFDGSMHLKNNYSDIMSLDTSFTDTGTLLRKSINKSSFKTIEKVQVN